jgi:hypothetical protein
MLPDLDEDSRAADGEPAPTYKEWLMKRLLLVLCVVAAGGGESVAGGHGCCAGCGCHHGLRKICRWECEEVEVKVPAWDCECEDIVIPGKSPFCAKDDCGECCDGGCDGCADGCDGCGHCGHRCVSHLGACLHHHKEWGPPCSCHVKTVKVLVRTEKTVKKKIWKPVIEEVCAGCSNHCGTGACPNGAGACANGSCAAGGAMDGDPMGPPTMGPEANPGLPGPPMPPEPSPIPQTSRRAINSLLSAIVRARR